MSGRKKSRSIRSLPISTENNQTGSDIQSAFDSELSKDMKTNQPATPINSVSTTNTSDLEGILDLGIKISGLSSGSSLSWSEEYESEVTKKVQLELEKLDRIFQGIEKDTFPYDANEIAEWKRHFPNLYILGQNTPTNSAENSDASIYSDEEISLQQYQQHNIMPRHVVFPRNRSSFLNKKQTLISQEVLNPPRNYNSLPRKPRSLEIDKYLKISSIRSPNVQKIKPTPPPYFTKHKEISDDDFPEYTSLPFITATPIKTQIRKRDEKNKPTKLLILPPIDNPFRSISATPRHASSKSMFGSICNERSSSKKRSQAARLKSDLMKLFEHIPISNR